MEIIIAALLLIVIVVLVVYVLLLKGQESTRVSAYAQQQFENWRARELESVQRQQTEVAQREASVNLARWKSDYEQSIRKEAVKKSHDVISGKVTEQLVPYLPSFRYNPRDARFIGGPVDFIVFDGLCDGEVKQVVFVEVKTGGSALSQREKQVRSVVEIRAVKWEELRIDHAQGVGTRPKTQVASLSSADNQLPCRAYSQGASYRVGETISHQTFGNGRVISVQHNKIEVQFSQGIKHLVQMPQ